MAESAAALVDRCYRRLQARKEDTEDAAGAVVGIRSLLAEVLVELGLAGRRSPAAEPERRFVDLDLTRFSIALVDGQAPQHPESSN